MPESTGDISGARPAGETSTGQATSTPSQEEIQAAFRERDSLKQSLQAVARERDEWKTKASEADSAPEPEPYLTPQAGADLVRKSIDGWWTEQQSQARQRMAVEQERQSWWGKAVTEVPEAADHNSPVYKKAVELLKNPAEGLVRTQDGQLSLAYPNAEYVAVLRAKAMLGLPSNPDTRSAAQFASAGGSSSGGAPASSTGDLSDEEYLKLSPEERARYQDRKFQEKHGVPP